MALEGENNVPMTMLVGPTATGNMGGYPYPVYMNGGNNGGFGGFGGDGWWIILLLLCGWGGFGGGFGGYGNMQLGYDFPWLLNGQQQISNNTNDGFRDAQLHDSITSVGDRLASLSTQLCDCCGQTQMSIANSTAAVQNSLCNGFNGVNNAIAGAQNAISNQLYNNEIASLNRSFAEQTANTAGFTAVNTGVADLKYTLASEACATRAANTANTQAILDKLCALELDGYKRENDQLRTQLNMANLAASQTAQTAQIRDGQNAAVNALVTELRSCPIPAQPVYGNTPIFTCAQAINPANNGCGCGCGGNGFAG